MSTVAMSVVVVSACALSALPDRRRTPAMPFETSPAARPPARARSTRARFVAALVLALLASASGRARAAGVFLGAQADTLAVAPGATFTVELRTLQPGAAFNAFDIGMLYDHSALTFVPGAPLSSQRGALMLSACTSTFHRFNALPDSLAITMVLLCSDVTVSGADVLYKLKFTAGTTPGYTRLRYGGNTQFFMGGTFIEAASKREVVVKIGSPVLGVGDEQPRTPVALALSAPRPNPARAGQALATEFALAADADVAFELLDALGRRVAERGAERYTAGRHRLAWALDRLPPGRYLLHARGTDGVGASRAWVVLR